MQAQKVVQCMIFTLQYHEYFVYIFISNGVFPWKLLIY